MQFAHFGPPPPLNQSRKYEDCASIYLFPYLSSQKLFIHLHFPFIHLFPIYSFETKMIFKVILPPACLLTRLTRLTLLTRLTYLLTYSTYLLAFNTFFWVYY